MITFQNLNFFELYEIRLGQKKYVCGYPTVPAKK